MAQVGLDGVMMRMNAEKNDDEVIEKRSIYKSYCCATI